MQIITLMYLMCVLMCECNYYINVLSTLSQLILGFCKRILQIRGTLRGQNEKHLRSESNHFIKHPLKKLSGLRNSTFFRSNPSLSSRLLEQGKKIVQGVSDLG